jgi:hypothetical protein
MSSHGSDVNPHAVAEVSLAGVAMIAQGSDT